MSQSARTASSTKKPSETIRPHYYTTFQNSCCASKANVTSSTQSKDVLPIPTKFKKAAESLLTAINEMLVENLSGVALYTSIIPSVFFQRDDPFQSQKYLIDRSMLRTLEEGDVINWNVNLKKLFPIRTSGNGNCLLHAVLIAMIDIHDIDLYLRDRLEQFMNENKDLLKNHWRNERIKADKNYGINSDDSELDGEWKDVCELVHYENSEDGQAATHLKFLEAVHIFSVCNMLRRPIIVLSEDVIRNKDGEAISVNDLYGIYLPILSPPTECINQPIVLAYDRSHFCPLQTSATEFERTMDNLLPLYPSINHIVEGTLLPIRFLGDDVTVENSNDLLREYLKIKEIDHIIGSDSTPIRIVCAELGSKYLASRDDFFLIYYDYVKDFFEVQKPRFIKEERDREIDESYSRYSMSTDFGRPLQRYDIPTRSTRTDYTVSNSTPSRIQNGRSYDLKNYSDDIQSGGAYVPRDGPLYLENYPSLPQISRGSPDYTKTTPRESTTDQTYADLTKKLPLTSNPDILSNTNGNGKMVNSTTIQVQGTDSRSNQERRQQGPIQIPVEIVKPSSSLDNQNLTIYERTNPPRDLCLLCDKPFNDRNSLRICPTCDYRIHPSTVYNDIPSRPSTRLRSTNIYVPTSDRYYTSLSPVPNTKPSTKVICPHCKNPNLAQNLTYNTDYRCSACQNPIPPAYRN